MVKVRLWEAWLDFLVLKAVPQKQNNDGIVSDHDKDIMEKVISGADRVAKSLFCAEICLSQIYLHVADYFRMASALFITKNFVNPILNTFPRKSTCFFCGLFCFVVLFFVCVFLVVSRGGGGGGEWHHYNKWRSLMNFCWRVAFSQLIYQTEITFQCW